jgi:hypothetical protein
MRAIGVCVRVEVEGRPTARAVLLDDVSGSPMVVDKFALTGDNVEFAQQLLDLSKGTSSSIRGMRPNRVVVRRADFPPAGSRAEGPKLRLLAEGAICAAAREHIPDTHLATGAEIGGWDGRGKAAVEVDAKALCKSCGLNLKWQDATMTAIGALAYR